MTCNTINNSVTCHGGQAIFLICYYFLVAYLRMFFMSFMNDKKTVFVVGAGAGASHEFSLPTGSDLGFESHRYETVR